MKGRNIRSWIVTLALTAGMVTITQAMSAQNQNTRSQQQPPASEQQPPSSGQQQQQNQQPRTYVGKIIKTKSGQYALLTDPQAGKGYYLDDQKDAQKYEQKNVQVVATLDPQTSTLHVIQIKLAS
jgi:hypothetical protein